MPMPKKPTKLKIIQGTNRVDRANPNEPQPENKIPSIPDHLNDIATKEWIRLSKELYNLGLLSEIDRTALAAYCEAYSMWVDACEQLKESDLLIETTNGNIIQNPIVGIVNQSRKAMKDYLTEFGMSPSSRSKVSAKKAGKKEDPWGKFG